MEFQDDDGEIPTQKNNNHSFSILNSNICTTYRMDFCEEITEFEDKRCFEIEPHKSKHRLFRILQIYRKFYEDKINENRIPLFCIQEIRTYNQQIFIDFFKEIGYCFSLFPTYPGIKTEEIAISRLDDMKDIENKQKIEIKRFSFINAIAIPLDFKVEKQIIYYLSDNPDKFSEKNDWGHCGSRVCGGLEILTPQKQNFKIFSTQFGMDVKERLKSAELLVNLMKEEKGIVILTGDFNSFSNLDEKVDLKGEEQIKILESAFTRIPINQGTFIGIRAVEKELYCMNVETGECGSCLDHIFIRGENIKYGKFYVISPKDKKEILFPYSDHCMIWADFETL